MPDLDRVEQRRDRRADRGPVRNLVVARPDQRLAQPLQAGRVTEFAEPGPPQQRAQSGIAERGLVELGEMGIAAGAVEQQGIADVIERRAVLPGRQRAVCGSGDLAKRHHIFFRNFRPCDGVARSPPWPRRPAFCGGRPSPKSCNDPCNPRKTTRKPSEYKEMHNKCGFGAQEMQM
jgi:hypothetical protein